MVSVVSMVSMVSMVSTVGGLWWFGRGVGSEAAVWVGEWLCLDGFASFAISKFCKRPLGQSPLVGVYSSGRLVLDGSIPLVIVVTFYSNSRAWDSFLIGLQPSFA